MVHELPLQPPAETCKQGIEERPWSPERFSELIWSHPGVQVLEGGPMRVASSWDLFIGNAEVVVPSQSGPNKAKEKGDRLEVNDILLQFRIWRELHVEWKEDRTKDMGRKRGNTGITTYTPVPKVPKRFRHLTRKVCQ
jgi:hypothetical protein